MGTKKGNVGLEQGSTTTSLGHVSAKLGGRRAALGYTSQDNRIRHKIVISIS